MRPPFKKLLQTSAVMTGAMALVLSSTGVAGATDGEPVESPGESAADLTLALAGDCVVEVTSDKDISNVKLYDETGMIQEIEDPSTISFDVTGATEVTAKSGTTETSLPVDCAPATPVEVQEPEVQEPEVPEPVIIEDDEDDAPVETATVELACVEGSLEVLTSKDLSNVKFYDADGNMIEELEGLSGDDNSFEIPEGAVKATAKSSTTEETIVFADVAECEFEDNTSNPPVDVIEDDKDKDKDEDEDEDDDAPGKTLATVDLDCVEGSLEVLTSKDLSNVKFYDADGNMIEELEGLSGDDNSFEIPEGAVKATAKSSTTEETIVFADVAECEFEDNGSTPPVDVIEDDDEVDEDGAEKVTICHATGSETNPYVVITVSVNSLKEGHGAHENDVIPAMEGVFEGSNLDMVDMIDEGCELEDETTTPIDDGDDNNVVVNDTDGEDVLGAGGTPDVEQTPGTDVEGNEVLRPVTPVIPVALPAVVPANPARPEAVLASTGNRAPQVLGSQVTRSPDALAATGAGTNNLVPFGLGLVLLGFAIQRKSKTLSAARVR